MKDPRARAVIEAAAKARLEAGREGDGRAAAASASRATRPRHLCRGDRGGRGRSRHRQHHGAARLVAAVDAGLIINPDGLANQIEGGIIQSTSWTLQSTSVRPQRHRRDDGRLSDPDVFRRAGGRHRAAQPAGRTFARRRRGSQGPTVAAIANAFANATGTRIRELPLTPERVKVALASPLIGTPLGTDRYPTVRYPVDASADVVKPGQ